MAPIKGIGDEWATYGFLALAFAFIFINVDKDIGGTYNALGWALSTFVLYFVFTGSNPYYTPKLLAKRQGILVTMLWSLGALAAFWLISNYVLSNFAIISLSVVQVLLASAPVLSSVKSIQFASFGQAIPYIETFLFFAVLFDFLLKIFNEPVPARFTFNVLVIITVISTAFTIFHLTAKINSPGQLYVSAVFAIISLALVVIRGQWLEALLIHVGVNSFTMFVNLYNSGLIDIMAYGVTIAIMAGIAVVFHYIQDRKIVLVS